jgi:hypothetical protein
MPFPQRKHNLDKMKLIATLRRDGRGGRLNDHAGFSTRTATGQKTSIAPRCPSRASVPAGPGALA